MLLSSKNRADTSLKWTNILQFASKMSISPIKMSLKTVLMCWWIIAIKSLSKESWQILHSFVQVIIWMMTCIFLSQKIQFGCGSITCQVNHWRWFLLFILNGFLGIQRILSRNRSDRHQQSSLNSRSLS